MRAKGSSPWKAWGQPPGTGHADCGHLFAGLGRSSEGGVLLASKGEHLLGGAPAECIGETVPTTVVLARGSGCHGLVLSMSACLAGRPRWPRRGRVGAPTLTARPPRRAGYEGNCSYEALCMVLVPFRAWLRIQSGTGAKQAACGVLKTTPVHLHHTHTEESWRRRIRSTSPSSVETLTALGLWHSAPW